MAEALLFVSTGSILIIGTATLGIAIITLRDARRYVERTERRMEYLREEQTRLLLLVHQELQSLKKELNRDLERRLEAQRWGAQRVGAKQLVWQEHEGREWGLRTRRDAEQRIDELKREMQEIQQDREVEQESSSPRPEGSSPTEEAQLRSPRPASSPERATSEPAEEDKRPRLAVWHPHPDDDISPGGPSAAQASALSDAPVRMFRKHYDRYLENYEGYVRLAERLYRMQDNAEEPSASLAEREWEERLRRVNDGIERTTARLDILEEFNPELATDDRISRRAYIALSHAELERSRRDEPEP